MRLFERAGEAFRKWQMKRLSEKSPLELSLNEHRKLSSTIPEEYMERAKRNPYAPLGKLITKEEASEYIERNLPQAERIRLGIGSNTPYSFRRKSAAFMMEQFRKSAKYLTDLHKLGPEQVEALRRKRILGGHGW